MYFFLIAWQGEAVPGLLRPDRAGCPAGSQALLSSLCLHGAQLGALRTGDGLVVEGRVLGGPDVLEGRKIGFFFPSAPGTLRNYLCFKFIFL